MPKLVCFAGYAGSGKDTAASVLLEQPNTVNVAIADAIWDALLAVDPLYGGNPISTWLKSSTRDEVKRSVPLVRAWLENLGKGGRQDGDIWLDLAVNNVCRLLDNGFDVVVTDVRTQHEASTFLGLPCDRDDLDIESAEVYIIRRPGVGPVPGGAEDNVWLQHGSPAYITGIIHNDSTPEALKAQVLALTQEGEV